jgi:CRP-like cAMP-binding protein
MERLKTKLAKHAIFKGLGKNYVQLIADHASTIRFKPGDVIFREGEEANQFYLLEEGMVVLEVALSPDRDPIVIQSIGEGAVLGWSWLFPPHRRRFQARAIAPARAIAIDGKFLRTKCEEDHDLGYELMKRFALLIEQRLRAVRIQNPDMYVVHA